MKEREAALTRELFEHWAGAPALPIQARVVAAAGGRGGYAGAEAPTYTVDVRPITASGEDDPTWPLLTEVECPLLWAGPRRGMVALPAVGSRVRVGFYAGDPSRPYVDAPLQFGANVPPHAADEFVLYAGDTAVRITPAGDVEIDAGQVNLGAGGLRAGVITEHSVCPVTGVPHGDGSRCVVAAKGVLL